MTRGAPESPCCSQKRRMPLACASAIGVSLYWGIGPVSNLRDSALAGLSGIGGRTAERNFRDGQQDRSPVILVGGSGRSALQLLQVRTDRRRQRSTSSRVAIESRLLCR